MILTDVTSFVGNLTTTHQETTSTLKSSTMENSTVSRVYASVSTGTLMSPDTTETTATACSGAPLQTPMKNPACSLRSTTFPRKTSRPSRKNRRRRKDSELKPKRLPKLNASG